MINHFYKDIVRLEKIIATLETIELAPEEKEALLHIAHDTVHHAILDMILSELDDDEKHVFLLNISDEDIEKIWAHLRSHIADVEDKIMNVSKDIEQRLLDDISEIIGSDAS